MEDNKCDAEHKREVEEALREPKLWDSDTIDALRRSCEQFRETIDTVFNEKLSECKRIILIV